MNLAPVKAGATVIAGASLVVGSLVSGITGISFGIAGLTVGTLAGIGALLYGLEYFGVKLL